MPRKLTIKPDYTTFERRARSGRGNLIPVWAEILADMETTVSVYRKLAAGSDCAFLLESVEHGANLGRYSFIGCNPEVVLLSRGEETDIHYFGAEHHVVQEQGGAIAFLRDYMRRYKPVPDPDLAGIPFIGGGVGYMGYDLVRSFERLPDSNPDDLRLPDAHFMIADTLAIFDHVRHRTILLANAHVGDDPRKAYDDAVVRIERLAARFHAQLRIEDEVTGTRPPLEAAKEDGLRSNFTREEFEQRVERIKQYIHAGDAFQVVFSQRFNKAYQGDPFDIYRALRAINPSPYMFYLKLGDMQLAGSSPEILVRVHNGKVIVRPIAGTRPRGKTQEEDQALERELLADPKELAEHIMLVDLGRNDAGRVATAGTVRVTDLKVIERYSHVMHIVSNVEGDLAPGLDAFDALAATFPAGTVSGAPKIRAMEIIDEVENVRRGPYAGAIGYFSFDGNLDTCITIRTCLIKDERVYFQAGGGIVADSVPALEYQESCNKAMAVLRAVEMAERGIE